jgi:hypothetical protein
MNLRLRVRSKNAILWNVFTAVKMTKDRRFGGTYRLDLQGDNNLSHICGLAVQEPQLLITFAQMKT